MCVLNDYDLIMAMQQGDFDKKDVLIKRYGRLVFSVTRRYKPRNAIMTQSLKQELWASLINRLQCSDLDHLAKYSTPEKWNAHHFIEFYCKKVFLEATKMAKEQNLEWLVAFRRTLTFNSDITRVAQARVSRRHSALNKTQRANRILEFDFLGNSCI